MTTAILELEEEIEKKERELAKLKTEVGTKRLQNLMAQSDLEENELSHLIIEMREE